MSQQADSNDPVRDDVPAGIPAEVTAAMLTGPTGWGGCDSDQLLVVAFTPCKVQSLIRPLCCTSRARGNDLGTRRYQGLAALGAGPPPGHGRPLLGRTSEDEMVELFPWVPMGRGGRRRRSTPLRMGWWSGPTSTTCIPTA